MQAEAIATLTKKVTDRPRPVLATPPRQYSAFVPTLLTAVALLGWLSLQTVQQLSEHAQLTAMSTGLMPQEQAAAKVRTSLEALATATAKLATAGNANAQTVVEQLRKRGITINAATTK